LLFQAVDVVTVEQSSRLTKWSRSEDIGNLHDGEGVGTNAGMSTNPISSLSGYALGEGCV
jgi:hypothetical protein